MDVPNESSGQRRPHAISTLAARLMRRLRNIGDLERQGRSLDADSTLGDTDSGPKRPNVLRKSSRSARSLSAGILNIQIAHDCLQSGPAQISPKGTGLASQYLSTGVQANLPSPAAPVSRSSSSTMSDAESTSASSSSSDYWPPLEDYGGHYPKLTFENKLDVGEWALPSGMATEAVSHASGQPSPLATFPHFTQLPVELRLKIWRLHLTRPRIVRVSTLDFVKKIHFTTNSLGNRSSNIQWYTTNKLPLLARVSQEARRETLSFYRIHLSAGMARRTFSFGPVYLNPEWDIILLNCSHEGTPMDILLNDIMAYDSRGIGAIHLASYCDPGLWDNTPLPGCADIVASAANLRSYTEVIYAGWSSRVDVFPILRLGQGYLQESIEVSQDKFKSFMRQTQRDNVYWSKSNRLRDRLSKVFGPQLAADLTVQSLYTRSVVTPRSKPAAVSLATERKGAGLIIWDKERAPKEDVSSGGEGCLSPVNGGEEEDEEQEKGGGRFLYFSCN
ncbi:2EXR family [Microdochium nivale]|nr:2EXR family [Microdochium nivale]